MQKIIEYLNEIDKKMSLDDKAKNEIIINNQLGSRNFFVCI